MLNLIIAITIVWYVTGIVMFAWCIVTTCCNSSDDEIHLAAATLANTVVGVPKGRRVLVMTIWLVLIPVIWPSIVKATL